MYLQNEYEDTTGLNQKAYKTLTNKYKSNLNISLRQRYVFCVTFRLRTEKGTRNSKLIIKYRKADVICLCP